MILLDAKSLHMKKQLEAVKYGRDLWKLWRTPMNETRPDTSNGQTENQLSAQVRKATGNLERAEVLRDKLTQMLDRLCGPTPKPAPEAEINKMVEQGTMPRLGTQLERTDKVIETAIQTLSEIEQYV